MKSSKSVEEYIALKSEWSACLSLLRDLLLNTELEETLKWGIPVYTIDGKNVVGISAFKKYVGLWYYQGVLLKDKSNKLINAQVGVTKALRQWRFTSLEEIQNDASLISEYISEAINNQKEGKAIPINRNKPLIIPVMFQDLLDSDKKLNQQFEAFSLSKKREFADYIISAKRESTAQSRLEKITPMIMKGVGLNDKYRK